MFNLDGGIHEIPVKDAPGRMWLCGKHYIAPRVDQVRQERDGALIVCLVEAHELRGRYDEYLDWLRANNGEAARWLPTHDLGVPEFNDALALFSDIAHELQAGRNVVVHCAAGIGRAGTTAVATLMILGSQLNDALDIVRQHRPMAGPEAGTQRELVQMLQTHLYP